MIFRAFPQLLTIGIFGLVHALVDCSSVAMVYQTIRANELSASDAFRMILLYNGIAFGTQWLFGIITDATLQYRMAAAFGIVALLLGMPFIDSHAFLCTVLAGAGNALFHTGGGALSLSIPERTHTSAGLFVGPGAVGLCMGMIFGGNADAPILQLSLLLAAALAFLAVVHIPTAPSTLPSNNSCQPQLFALLPLLLLLFAIAVRAVGSRVGFTLPPGSGYIALVMSIAACCGKILGGFSADRFGWRVTIGISSIGAVAMLLSGNGMALPLICGMFFLQMTMPVTLVGCSRFLPGKTGLSFGLASAALVAGSYPTFFPNVTVHISTTAVVFLIQLSLAAIFIALHFRNGCCKA